MDNHDIPAKTISMQSIIAGNPSLTFTEEQHREFFESLDVTIIPEVLQMIIDSEERTKEVHVPGTMEHIVGTYFRDMSSANEVAIMLSIRAAYVEVQDSLRSKEAKKKLFGRLLGASMGKRSDPLFPTLQRQMDVISKQIRAIMKRNGGTIWCYKSDGRPFMKP